MSGRTFNPIPQGLGALLNRYGIQTQQTRAAIMGDGKGNLAVVANADDNSNEHMGKYWIQLAIGNDNGGNTRYGEGQKARLGDNVNIPENQGTPIRVYKDRRNGEWVIQCTDNRKLKAAGVNPISYNFFRYINSWWARFSRDGRVFIPNQLNSGDTLYTIESYIGLWDGDRQFYEHARGISDNLDLTSYVPTSGNERLILIAYLPYEESYQIISGATRTIASTAFTLSYLNDMTEQLKDYAMPKGCLRLQNAQTTITAEDFRIDLRQWFATPRPRGFPKTISVPTTIITGYQQMFHGSLTINSDLTLDGELAYI